MRVISKTVRSVSNSSYGVSSSKNRQQAGDFSAKKTSRNWDKIEYFWGVTGAHIFFLFPLWLVCFYR